MSQSMRQLGDTPMSIPPLGSDALGDLERYASDLPRVLAPMLGRSREQLLTSAPERVAEPADFVHLLSTAGVPELGGALSSTATSERRRGRGLRDLGVAELLEAFGSGTVKPTELLAELRRAWEQAPEGSGILHVVDGAQEAATAADRAWAEGRARPLEGIPFAVKDIIDVAGALVTGGSVSTGDRRAERDACAVDRLRRAGAIPVLMVATTEFASGAVINKRYGPARNPWNRERWTGGSSTGSAAVLAARLVPLALGTDTGGSIRVPASLCGITGIKPTYGLVPRTGVSSLSWSLDHVGPMARSATDLRIVLPHLLGGDGVDPVSVGADISTAVSQQLSEGESAARPLRVGIPTAWFTFGQKDALDLWRAIIDELREGGAAITAVDLPDLQLMDDEFVLMVATELLSAHEGNLGRLPDYDERVQGILTSGATVPAVDYLRALRRRPQHLQAALDAMRDIDVLVLPGVAAPAQPLEATEVNIEGQSVPLLSFTRQNTSPGDVLGLPVVMIPAGLVDGMPVGVQIMGKPWGDATCLAVAEMLQERTRHHELRPPS